MEPGPLRGLRCPWGRTSKATNVEPRQTYFRFAEVPAVSFGNWGSGVSRAEFLEQGWGEYGPRVFEAFFSNYSSQVCTIPCRGIEDDVSIFVDGDLKCPLSRSVACLDLEPRLEVMTYPI